jgi:hypothetical protein
MPFCFEALGTREAVDSLHDVPDGGDPPAD